MNRESPQYRDFLLIKKLLEESCSVQVFAIGGTYLQGYVNTLFTRDIDVVVVISSLVSNSIDLIVPVLNKIGFTRQPTTLES